MDKHIARAASWKCSKAQSLAGASGQPLRRLHGVAAIIAGLDVNGLGVARSLGGAGFPVIALETNAATPFAATRHARVRTVRALSGGPFVTALKEIRQDFDTDPVLFLTQEASVATVCDAYDELRPIFRLTTGAPGLTRRLLDKLTFQEMAERQGSAIPKSIRLRRGLEDHPLSSLRFPCILKPATKDPAYGKRFAKAYRVSEPSEIEALWAKMREVIEEAIVQEWIEGDDADVYFCLQYRPRGGQTAISFCGRKLRQWPPLVGGTAACVPCPEVAAEVEALTDAFFTSLRVEGLCSMEYKRDRRDGRFYMVEPTVGRTDFQEEIAALNGVNLPLAAYLSEIGQPVAERKSVRPCGWRDPYGDAHALAAGANASASIPLKDAYWRWDDPGPTLWLAMETIGRRLGGLSFLSRGAKAF